jgi:ribonucleoside-diphosphate reductase alpha chain
MEQMLAPGGICCLGTMNLTQFVNVDRTGFDMEQVSKYAQYLVRFLDNVNSYSDAPLPEYVYTMRNKRRIGCGIMGWGSSLFMMKIRFGSAEAKKIQEDLLKVFTHAVVRASLDLAEEKGMFPLCEPEKHVLSPYWDNISLPESLRERMKKTGIRNSSLLSMQPNGNSSCLAQVVSGGIEPVFMPEYIRTVIVTETPDHLKDVTPNWSQGEWFETSFFKFVQEGDEQMLRGVDENGTVYKIDKSRGLTKEVLCQDYGARYLSRLGEWDPTADWAATTTQLSVAEHLQDLTGFAKAVDSACSKCVDLKTSMAIIDGKIMYFDELPMPAIDDMFVDFSGEIQNHKKEPVKIKSLYRNGIKDTIEIKFDDGSSLCCTENHRLWVDNMWIKAIDLSVGSLIG